MMNVKILWTIAIRNYSLTQTQKDKLIMTTETNNKKQLVVSEVFYSIQGEGQTMGHPSVFLRLAGCNLLCKSKDWICDSIEVWQKGIKTNFEDVLPPNYIVRLREGAHLILTGGEPLLHQKKLIDYLKWFWFKYHFYPTIEVETNGTIIPDFELANHITYWNVSPKLENSGETMKRRVNQIAIHSLNSLPNCMFKFVIKERDDVLGILTEYKLNMDKVWLMPAGSSQEELNETRQLVAELAIEMGVRYTERIHVNVWDKATGV